MEHLSNHDLAWYNASAEQPMYRAGTGIPANDPPGTLYKLWHKNLSDQGYVAGAPSLMFQESYTSWKEAMAAAIQFSENETYPVGVLYIVPMGENPNGPVGYSAVFG